MYRVEVGKKKLSITQFSTLKGFAHQRSAISIDQAVLTFRGPWHAAFERKVLGQQSLTEAGK